MKTCITTLCMGNEWESVLKLSKPYFEKYADKCGVDFQVMPTNGLHPHAFWFKLDCFKSLPKYDRILFVDCDVLIRPSAPNIFDIVPEGTCALYDESELGAADRKSAYNYYLQEHNKELASYNLPKISPPYKGVYYNVGVFVVDKKCNFLVTPIKELMMPWPEQTYFNIMINQLNIPSKSLPRGFNDIRVYLKKPFGKNTYFVHYAGMSVERTIYMMQKDIEGGYIN